MSAKNQKRKHINLLPKEDFDKTTLGRILRWALTTFRFIVIIVELVVVSGFLSRFYLDVKIGDLDDEINQKSAAIQTRSDFERSFRKTQLKLSVLSTLSSEDKQLIPLVNLIGEIMPTDTQLVSISKLDNVTTIKANALNEASISFLLDSLKESEKFTSVSLLRVEKDSESQFTTFTLELTS